MGHTLLIGQTNQSIYPVNAMKHYLTRRGITPGPLFIIALGRPLTKDALTAETRQLLSHSFVKLQIMPVIAIELAQRQLQLQRAFPHGWLKH